MPKSREAGGGKRRLTPVSRDSPYFCVPIVDLYGHEPLRQRLSASAAAGTLPASILFQGPRGVGKQRL
ncbi:MAG TPA: hypothetical protein VE110_08440, partial [Gemmatimonadaceae bacterium]|nr:hypothetical protein [Gemmatimonadaceae bacterium]